MIASETIININEFQSNANRLPGRLQSRYHVSCDVHSVRFSDVRHHTIDETVLSWQYMKAMTA